MKKTFLFFLVSVFSYSQSNQLWKGYYSYNEIVDISFGNEKVVASTENALFLKNITSGDLNIKNSIDGFKPEVITTVYYSETYKLTFTGNSNGLIIITRDNGTIINKIDIINEVPVPPNQKKINHFYEYDDKIYISTDYGISVLKLSNLEFEDTYFIGSNGIEVQVLQTTVFNDEIYAVTSNQGIKKAQVTNPNLIDFNQWQTFDNGFWRGITNFNNQLVALNLNNIVYRYNVSFFQQVLAIPQAGIKFISTQENLIITCDNHVFVLDVLFSLVAHITQIPDNINTFSCAVTVGNNLFIGTKKDGLFLTQLSNPFSFQALSPNGPVQNSIFRVKKTSQRLWATYGDYDRTYNSYNPTLGEFPVSKYNESTGWDFIPFSDLLGATSLTDIVPNPINENEVYIGSNENGLLKINDEEIVLFNQSNTGPNGLESLVDPSNPGYISVRINGTAFDSNRNLWITNAWINRGLKVLRSNGTWQSFDLTNIFTEPFFERYAKIAIDKNDTKWIPSFRSNGLIGFNEKFNNKFILIKGENEGNLPSLDVRCIAIDKRNQIWIGTFRGLRILSSVDRFISETELSTTPIIIEEDGLAQELFFQQSILDIEVDGANNKWVSIAGAGVFLVSPNGQSTLQRFTKENSPLPSNNIIDIEIDGATGEVYFATEKGLISFKGTNTNASDNLSNVFIYPNPVRPNFLGTVKISGLIDRANIKITDIEGNLVHETTSVGGTVEWDTTAFGKYKVASGVYMVFISSDDAIETKVKKIMIVR